MSETTRTQESRESEIRASLEASGSLHIPEHLLDPNFQYAWLLCIHDKPGKFERFIRQGWAPVKSAELHGQRVGENFLTQQGISMTSEYVVVSENQGHNAATSYLCKIPKDIWAVMKKIKTEKADESEQRAENKMLAASPGSKIEK